MNTSLVTIVRASVRHTRGNMHGPVTQLVSPGDLSPPLKPFMFPTCSTIRGQHSAEGR